MNKIEELIKQLTIEEKASLLSGRKSWHTNKISRLNIPSIYITDGPHGLRKKKEESNKEIGFGNTEISTCFPAAVTSGATWNKDLLYQMGNAMGVECNHYDVNIILGPAINIKRNPLCGRNFEYFSEDPLITGILGSKLTQGIEIQKVGTSVKHFACNNNELNRYFGNSIVDNRAFREIYLKAFERIIKEANPATVMCAYNMVNDEFASENKTLLTDILRKEWGYTGLVMSDWGAVNDRVLGVKAGLDLEMPGDVKYNRQQIVDAYKKGKLSIDEIDTAVRNILNMVYKYLDHPINKADFDENSKLSRMISNEGAILLKNDNNILPLNKKSRFVVIGELFEKMRYQGAGSSLIRPYKLITPKNAFDKNNIDYVYQKGYDLLSFNPNEKLEQDAIACAEQADTILFFGGLSEMAESEGLDRTTLSIPSNQLSLLNKLIHLGKKIIFVMYGGSPVELPFYNDINGLLNMCLPGQEGGNSTFDLLFGNVCPSGRLAETWPLSISDIPFVEEFCKNRNELYKESIFVGYRYYNTYNRNVRFPFGYGLSYSKFEYSNLNVNVNDDNLEVSVDIKNIGNMKAKEVIEVFIMGPDSNIIKPILELRGFDKVELDINETKKCVINIPFNDLKYFIDNKWVLENGEYKICICKDVNNVVLSTGVYIESSDTIEHDKYLFDLFKDHNKFINMSNTDFEKVVGRTISCFNYEKPYDLNTPLSKYKTFGGKMLYNLLVKGAFNMYKKAHKSKDLANRETKIKNAYFTYLVFKTLSLRSMCNASEGLLSHRRALGLLDIANNHFLRGIWKLITPERGFKLPR